MLKTHNTMIIIAVLLIVSFLSSSVNGRPLSDDVRDLDPMAPGAIDDDHGSLAKRKARNTILKGPHYDLILIPAQVRIVDPMLPGANPDEEPSTDELQGDMKLTPLQREYLLGKPAPDDHQGPRRVKRKATADLAKRWLQNTVPYVIEESASNSSSVILQAMEHWEEQTCVKFVPYTQTVAEELQDDQYLSFFLGSSCWSYIGKVTTVPQKLSIGPKCSTFGTITHEIGHAIGFFHEQTRPDRDEYVVVHEENILTEELGNYIKRTYDDVVTDVPYDVKSIMHYRAYAET
eukprot:XP_796702.3 PREDICTED: protein SpAN [Strongylocentrotus purpuratus]